MQDRYKKIVVQSTKDVVLQIEVIGHDEMLIKALTKNGQFDEEFEAVELSNSRGITVQPVKKDAVPKPKVTDKPVTSGVVSEPKSKVKDKPVTSGVVSEPKPKVTDKPVTSGVVSESKPKVTDKPVTSGVVSESKPKVTDKPVTSGVVSEPKSKVKDKLVTSGVVSEPKIEVVNNSKKVALVSNLGSTSDYIGDYKNPPILKGYRYLKGEWNNGFSIIRNSDGSILVWCPVGFLDSDGFIDSRHRNEKFGRRARYNDEEEVLERLYGELMPEALQEALHEDIIRFKSDEELMPKVWQEELRKEGISFKPTDDVMFVRYWDKKRRWRTFCPIPVDISKIFIWKSKKLLKQYESVKKYGGFYFSAYNISRKPGCEEQYCSISGALPLEVDYMRALDYAVRFENQEKYTSHLLFGAEYDSILAWLIKSNAKTYGQIYENSRSWGNFETLILQKTGSREEWSVNGIYDLAGNTLEWTSEFLSSQYDGHTGIRLNSDANICARGFSRHCTRKNDLCNAGVFCVRRFTGSEAGFRVAITIE